MRGGPAQVVAEPGELGADPVLEGMPERRPAESGELGPGLGEQRLGGRGVAGPCAGERRGQQPGRETRDPTADEESGRGAALHERLTAQVAGRHLVERRQHAGAIARRDRAERLDEHLVDARLERAHQAVRGLGPVDRRRQRLLGLGEVAAPQVGHAEVVVEHRLVRGGRDRLGEVDADQRRLDRLLVAAEAGRGVGERRQRPRLADHVAERAEQPRRLPGAAVRGPKARGETVEVGQEEQRLGLAMRILALLGVGQCGEGDLAGPLRIGFVEVRVRWFQHILGFDCDRVRIKVRGGGCGSGHGRGEVNAARERGAPDCPRRRRFDRAAGRVGTSGRTPARREASATSSSGRGSNRAGTSRRCR